MPPSKSVRKIFARLGRRPDGRPAPRVLTKAQKRARHLARIKAEMVRWQRETSNVWAKAPFVRIVREIVRDLRRDFLVASAAYEALAQASQQYIHEFFLDADLAREFAGRQTLMQQDARLIRALWSRFGERVDLNASHAGN